MDELYTTTIMLIYDYVDYAFGKRKLEITIKQISRIFIITKLVTQCMF